jgi:hypothetical protein
MLRAVTNATSALPPCNDGGDVFHDPKLESKIDRFQFSVKEEDPTHLPNDSCHRSKIRTKDDYKSEMRPTTMRC